MLIHPPRLCTQLCRCGRRIRSGIIIFTFGNQLLISRVVSDNTASSPRVRVWDLFPGLKRSGNTDGAT